MIAAQAAVQTRISPGKWVSFARRSHEEIEKWILRGAVDEVMDYVVMSVKNLDGNDIKVHKISRESSVPFIKIHILTPGAKWLDIMELRFKLERPPNSSSDTAGDINPITEITSRCYSSGIVPLIIPGATLLSAILFFIPFKDIGKCAKSLKRVRNQLAVTSGQPNIAFSTIQRSKGHIPIPSRKKSNKPTSADNNVQHFVM